MKVNIRDRNFGHDISSCANTPSKYIEWVRDNVPVSDVCFITDMCLEDVKKASGVKRKVAWILEPRSIHPHSYAWIEKNNKLFDFVLTFDQNLIDRGENYLYYPHGRCWIKNYVDKPKTKMCSIFASEKAMTEGHRLRHQVIDYNGEQMDCFGEYVLNRLENKEDGLNDYRYSVTIENAILPGYWTEKLLDCFATKTIPIYYGDKDSVNKFFNKNGIIYFNSLNDIDLVLSNMSEDDYNMRLSAVEENYSKVEQFRVPEDWIFENYKFLFE
jgi:hypothetical protein